MTAAEQYDEDRCLQIIAYGEEDAEDLLLSQVPTARRRFKALDKALRKYIADVQESFPDAQYYTASGGFHLMLGRSHNSSEHGQTQLIALSGRAQIGDGDF